MPSPPGHRDPTMSYAIISIMVETRLSYSYDKQCRKRQKNETRQKNAFLSHFVVLKIYLVSYLKGYSKKLINSTKSDMPP